jgi:hypothetical protein
MVMQWLTGRKAARAGGRNGVVAILADVSGSMDMDVLKPAFRAVVQAVPGARVFIFADTVAEVTRAQASGGLPDVGGGTNMQPGLEAVERLRPQLTIVLSDGGVYGEEALFATADRMTGAISSLWFGPDDEGGVRWWGRDFMEELARRGGGDFRKYSFSRGADALVLELLHIVRRQEIHHHYAPPVHVYHDGGGAQFVQRGPSTVRITRR